MTTRKPISAIAAVLILAFSGCQSRQDFLSGSPSPVRDSRTLTIQELATRLNLRIDEQDETFVVLRDGTNTVLIFTHDDARFFVNGRPAGSAGPVRKTGGTVYVSETLVDQIRARLGTAPPARPGRPTQRARIVVDPGHGGHDPGTIATNGGYEKDVNLGVASKLAGILQRRGHQVTMTRQGDRFIELESRAAIANRRDADLFVSIHADSAPDPSAQGFTVYIANSAARESQQVAQAIIRAMKTTGLRSRGVRREDYRVLVKTSGPAVLVELGYMSNAREARKLQDSTFQNRLAVAIAAGIGDYLR
ncbi:MAG: N-acetylmuramoyl-L-alanine amidase [Phycisphaerales bacterium]|nr:MAG: N-acetylmuramoyl-L-alanine amidase [Phycisphaerales bacterium]